MASNSGMYSPPVLEHFYTYDNFCSKKIKKIMYNVQTALDEIDILVLILFVLFLKNTILIIFFPIQSLAMSLVIHRQVLLNCYVVYLYFF